MIAPVVVHRRAGRGPKALATRRARSPTSGHGLEPGGPAEAVQRRGRRCATPLPFSPWRPLAGLALAGSADESSSTFARDARASPTARLCVEPRPSTNGRRTRPRPAGSSDLGGEQLEARRSPSPRSAAPSTRACSSRGRAAATAALARDDDRRQQAFSSRRGCGILDGVAPLGPASVPTVEGAASRSRERLRRVPPPLVLICRTSTLDPLGA